MSEYGEEIIGTGPPRGFSTIQPRGAGDREEKEVAFQPAVAMISVRKRAAKNFLACRGFCFSVRGVEIVGGYAGRSFGAHEGRYYMV